MTCRGTVRSWDDEEGWGVIDSPETPGGCWAHFSSVARPGDGSGPIVVWGSLLETGDDVLLDWAAVDQDGYGFRAERVERLAD